jgi:ParB family transcriptional regulator, chromosome partitioning protein
MKQKRPTLAGLLALQDDGIPSSATAPPQPVAGVASGALRAMSSTLLQMSEDANRGRELQTQISSGQQIVDLRPEAIEASFIVDRIVDHEDASFESFVESIKEHGQQVPILVRPHPEMADKFQVAYGHRRLRAAARLGITVRAIVRSLSDAELVVAQGKENLERQDLSFIERASFAHNLEQRGFDRKTIAAALGIEKGHLSNLISVARSIPDAFIIAIGPASKAGKPRWMELAQKLKEPGKTAAAKKLIGDPAFRAVNTDIRFARLMAALTEKTARALGDAWSNTAGAKVINIARRPGRTTLHIDEKIEPEFAEFLVGKLDDIYTEFKRRC